jgi:hypothetical protein
MPDLTNSLLPFLDQFHSQALTEPAWSSRTLAFIRDEVLPMDEIEAHVGVFAAMSCTFAYGFFEFNDDSEAAIVFEVLGDNDESTIDLCAFSLERSNVFGTAIGAATVLGGARVANPATWFAGPLPIFRTPLNWLKAGGQGAVILNHRQAPVVLGQALGPILAEDVQHARDLKMMLCSPLVDPANILAPAGNTVRRAA